MKALVFGAGREGYGIDQVNNPMTVGELKEMLEYLDDDTAIILSHDNGYTYGSLSRWAELRESEDGEEFEVIDEYRI
jgi:hypothetical protein